MDFKIDMNQIFAIWELLSGSSTKMVFHRDDATPTWFDKPLLGNLNSQMVFHDFICHDGSTWVSHYWLSEYASGSQTSVYLTEVVVLPDKTTISGFKAYRSKVELVEIEP